MGLAEKIAGLTTFAGAGIGAYAGYHMGDYAATHWIANEFMDKAAYVASTGIGTVVGGVGGLLAGIGYTFVDAIMNR